MRIRDLKGQKAHLTGLASINVIMGRNGAGKSRFLRDIEDNLIHARTGQAPGIQSKGSQATEQVHVRYVSPERAGTFKRDGNVLTNMSNNPDWLRYSRSKNQVTDFKPASATLFRDAETIYLRRLEEDPTIRGDYERTFRNDRLSKINRLLTNISFTMGATDFEFRSLVDDTVIPADQISSGESEAVALAAEILYFFDTIDPAKTNILLLDEPDVHLHPDLQARLGKLIIEMIDEFEKYRDRVVVCITTHSTPLISSLASSEHVAIGTKSFGVEEVHLKPASAEFRKAAPFFGHPLSLALSRDAPLIMEGEDDERVWQQAARTSQGRIRVFPVLAGSVNQQGELEKFCKELLDTLYDDPIAFSLRDGDGVIDEPLEHQPPVKRYRLRCYAIENALLTDECLAVMGSSWQEFVAAASRWIIENGEHRDVGIMERLIASPDRLRHTKIKPIRQLVCAVLGCGKPWEVVVGQAIGALSDDDVGNASMLVDFLDPAMVRDIVFRDVR